MKEQKTWTILEIEYIKANVKLNNKNQVTNQQEIALKLNRSVRSIYNRIGSLRKDGYLPKCTISKKANGHKWTTKEVDFLKDNIIYDNRNRIMNLNQLASELSLDIVQIQTKVNLLRQKDEILSVKRTTGFGKNHERYSDDSIKIIIGMRKQSATSAEVANVLDRSESAISGKVHLLKKDRVIESKSKKYSEQDVNYLITNIRLDEHGYVSNIHELCNYLHRPYRSVVKKLHMLREEGLIERTADRTTTCVSAKKAFREFNDMRFAKYAKKKGENKYAKK